MLGAVEALARVDQNAVDWDGLDSVLSVFGSEDNSRDTEFGSAVGVHHLQYVCATSEETALTVAQPIRVREKLLQAESLV